MCVVPVPENNCGWFLPGQTLFSQNLSIFRVCSESYSPALNMAARAAAVIGGTFTAAANTVLNAAVVGCAVANVLLRAFNDFLRDGNAPRSCTHAVPETCVMHVEPSSKSFPILRRNVSPAASRSLGSGAKIDGASQHITQFVCVVLDPLLRRTPVKETASRSRGP